MSPGCLPYASAEAFNAALTERLRALSGSSARSITQLRRQFAYDRLLARLFHGGTREWVLKGGVSMIARLDTARHTADVDLVTVTDSADTALAALREDAARDLGDFFTFRFAAPRSLIQGVPGLRIATEAWLGVRRFERFGVDLVHGLTITGRTELADPLLPLEIPGLIRPRYRLYPLVDVIADKVMATVETHNGRPSTRFRDLVDLTLIARSQVIPADGLATALTSERVRRGLPRFAAFSVPDEALWRPGYASAVRDVPGVDRTLTSALALTTSFLNPVLGNMVCGCTWDPETLAWGADRKVG
jgi:hypothetical protein